MNFKFIPEQRLGSTACWLVCLVAFLLVMGCKSENQESREQYQATLNPENGKIVKVNGEEFRIVYIGGVRFRFPVNHQFGWTGGHASGPTTDGMDISLYWPDIPPGKAPGTKFKALEGQRDKTNLVLVLVTGTEKPIEIDKSKEPGFRERVSTWEYVSRDDLKLGLRIISLKDHPESWAYAYSLTNDAVEPWGGQPVVLSRDRIHFSYAPKVEVRMTMMGWGTVDDEINPHWKDTYLGVVETLNKFREDK